MCARVFLVCPGSPRCLFTGGSDWAIEHSGSYSGSLCSQVTWRPARAIACESAMRTTTPQSTPHWRPTYSRPLSSFEQLQAHARTYFEQLHSNARYCTAPFCTEALVGFVGRLCRLAACGLCGDQRGSQLRRITTVTKLEHQQPAESAARTFVGTWYNTSTSGLEDYLKCLGVSWVESQLALRFRPKCVFSITDGVLQVRMPTPMGERVEKLPIDTEVVDRDPLGNEFIKHSYWDGSVLVTLAQDRRGKLADVRTTRAICDGALVQRSSIVRRGNEGSDSSARGCGDYGDAEASGDGAVCFERIFKRQDAHS